MKGVIKKWITGRNYGFIETDEVDQDVFVHGSAVDSEEKLSEGQEITFEVEESAKGPKAKNVKLVK